MSSGSQETRATLLAELAQELTQFNGLGASFFRAAAARLGVTITDMQVIESLSSSGPMTAGQLADLTGLTTGAITGMINRLEEAGLVSRERDPEDGRRVIVQLTPDIEQEQRIGPIFGLLRKAWQEQTSHYDDGQIAFLVDFFKHANTVARQEILWLREAPGREPGAFSAPLDDLASGQLLVSGAARLIVRAGGNMTDLYQAHFEGPLPDVKTKDGTVTMRYPRRLWMLSTGQNRTAEITLNAAIPWRIAITGGVSEIAAELNDLDLMGLEVKGGMSMVRLELPAPSRIVPVYFSGGASDLLIRRPAGVAARVHLKGWVSTFVLDDQSFTYLGNDVRLQTPGDDATNRRYDIEVASSASMVTITAKS